MPKQTYFNLDQNKRERINQALIHEYTAVPLEEVSIKHIVQDAGIPRGSFYQYFQDKEDALCFLIMSSQNNEEELIRSVADFMDIDVFDFIKAISRRELQGIEDNTPSIRMRLLQQIAASPRGTTLFQEIISGTVTSSELFKRCWANSGFDLLDSREHQAIILLLITAMKESLLSVLYQRCSMVSALQQLKITLDIIKAGADSLKTTSHALLEGDRSKTNGTM